VSICSTRTSIGGPGERGGGGENAVGGLAAIDDLVLQRRRHQQGDGDRHSQE